MYAIHHVHARLSHVPDSKQPWGICSKGGLYLLLRHDESALTRSMLAMIFNEAHPDMKDCPIVLPADAYLKSYSELSEDARAQVMWKAYYALNQFCRKKRLLRHGADSFKLVYFNASSLAVSFGNYS
jgi:hypothetical protein